MPTLWNRRKRRKPRTTKPLRPRFLRLRRDRTLLLERRQHYIHDYARILNKLKFRERVVRELLRLPGGPPITNYHHHQPQLDLLQHKSTRQGIKLKGKELRLLTQVHMMNEHQQHLNECQLIFFAFQFEIHARAVIEIQKIWRACVTRPPFYIMRYNSRVALAAAFVAVYKIPWLQPNIKYRIALSRHQYFLKRRKASFRISVTMKRHLKIMKTLRYIHPLLDMKIKRHKQQIVACKVLQQWYHVCKEKSDILKKALAYSANLRQAQAEKERSVNEQQDHEASKVLQEWVGHIIILKHTYARKIFCALHQTMRERLKKIDLKDPYQSRQLLRRLMDEDIEKQTQQHLAHVMRLQHVVETKTATSRARGRARVEEEGYVNPNAGYAGGPEESIVLNANEFDVDAPIPPTVLPYTGLFPNLDSDRLLTVDELAGTSWNFWMGIERLNKDLWVPELVREDKELHIMAKSLITWYIGENEPIVQQLSVGKALSKHKYLTPMKKMYTRGTLLPGGGSTKSVVKGGLNHFIWFAPELLCPQCNSFLEGSTLPDGKCGECGLPPHYSRVERKVTRMGNRYHCTTSYTSLRLGVDLFIIHAMFRSIALRSHYAGHGRSVPVYEAWNMAITESKPIISKLVQYGCTKLEHLPHVPLTSIGVPGKTVLLLRNILWHINNVLHWAKDNSPYEFTMHPPSRDLQWLMEEEKRVAEEEARAGEGEREGGRRSQRRPKTAPIGLKRVDGTSSRKKRPKTSGGIRSRTKTRKKKGGLENGKTGKQRKRLRKKKKKRPATSPMKSRGEAHLKSNSLLLPEILDNNPALRECWEEVAMTPPKQYKRPSTAPIWMLGGSLVVGANG